MRRLKKFRRYQKEKRIKRLFNIFKNESIFTNQTKEALLNWAKKRADNPKINKCQCCCNPRRCEWRTLEERKTIQERKLVSLEKELEESNWKDTVKNG